VTEAGAFAAWLGGAIVLLSDGRRGLALGLAVLAAGLAALAFAAGDQAAAGALLAGGAGAAALRLRAGREGWGLMPAGSTPRLILSVVAALLSLWVAVAVTAGPGGGLRFAVLASLVLLVARLLQGADPAASTTAASGIALVLGAGTVLAAGAASDAACIVAALISVGLQALPRVEADGA
jgi:hypothetical protein